MRARETHPRRGIEDVKIGKHSHSSAGREKWAGVVVSGREYRPTFKREIVRHGIHRNSGSNLSTWLTTFARYFVSNN